MVSFPGDFVPWPAGWFGYEEHSCGPNHTPVCHIQQKQPWNMHSHLPNWLHCPVPGIPTPSRVLLPAHQVHSMVKKYKTRLTEGNLGELLKHNNKQKKVILVLSMSRVKKCWSCLCHKLFMLFGWYRLEGCKDGGYKYKVLHTNRLKPGHWTFKAAQLQSNKGF